MAACTSGGRWPLLLLLTAALPAGCGSDHHGSGSPPPDTRNDWFTSRAEDIGLDFVHFNGMSGKFYFPEMLPPGVALFDYDNDGDLDVFLVQGQMLGESATPTEAPRGSLPLRGRLYRNDLEIHAD